MSLFSIYRHKYKSIEELCLKIYLVNVNEFWEGAIQVYFNIYSFDF